MTVESVLTNREVLYLIAADGCAACAAAKPLFEEFSRKHPRLLTLVIDASGPHPTRLGLKVKATPTYLYRRGQEAITHVGALKATEIEKWLKKLGSASL